MLRHEIHNSVSPITLISSGLANIYEKDGDPINPMKLTLEEIQSTIKGLQTINKRSKGLSAFVEQYRTLTQLPQPTLLPVAVDSLLSHVISLAESIRPNESISITKMGATGLVIQADEKLLEQVLLNLLKNAIEAIEITQNGKVIIETIETQKGITISVSDNGVGIDATNMDQIFTPFFTTKKDGTGIGLSLSRQIMRLHGGNLTAVSGVNGTTFTISM